MRPSGMWPKMQMIRMAESILDKKEIDVNEIYIQQIKSNGGI